MIELTIGMATYQDFDGVYFSVQDLRLHHDMENVEILIVDNYGCNSTAAMSTQRQPQITLQRLERALRHAQVLKGARGEAGQFAEFVLQQLSAA